MPQRFPEHGWLLTYREAVELLPDDVKPYAANLVWSMQPLALWEDSPTPHVPRPVPPTWRKPPLHGTSSLELASAAVVQTRDGAKHLTLYFDPKQVKEVGKRWTTPNRGGRPSADWQELVAGAKDVDDAVSRLPPLPRDLERFFEDQAGTARVRISRNHDVTRKHFQKALRRLNPKPK